jgi:antitoxin YefM
MRSVPVSEAELTLGHLVDEVAASSEPVIIAGARADAVLISADDWRAIEETLYLLGLPGMRESIISGLATPVSECDDDPGW